MMKANTKRGAAAPGAQEERYAPESEWVGREPAPAGALQRSKGGAFVDSYAPDLDEVEDSPYKPRLGSLRVRVGARVPKSTVGRVIVGGVGLVALGAAAVAVLSVQSYLLHDERFVIPASSQIQTEGNMHLTRAQVLSVFGEDVERNIFKVPLAERRADLERLPWVAHATVMRLLPNRIRVAVVERTPVAFVRQGSHIGLVDGNGVLLDMPEDAPGDPHYSFPVLTGLAADDPLSTRAARMEIYKRFMKELDGAGTKISDSLSEVDVSSPEDVKALIPSGGTDVLVHFGDEDFLTRYRHFEQHLPEWKQQYPKLASADMRYERQVVLEMAKGAGVPVGDGSAPRVDGGGAPADRPRLKPQDSGAVSTAGLKPSPNKAKSSPAATPVEKPAQASAGPQRLKPDASLSGEMSGLKARPTDLRTSAVSVAAAPKANSKMMAKPVSAANAKMYAALAAARQAQAGQSQSGQVEQR